MLFHGRKTAKSRARKALAQSLFLDLPPSGKKGGLELAACDLCRAGGGKFPRETAATAGGARAAPLSGLGLVADVGGKSWRMGWFRSLILRLGRERGWGIRGGGLAKDGGGGGREKRERDQQKDEGKGGKKASDLARRKGGAGRESRPERSW